METKTPAGSLPWLLLVRAKTLVIASSPITDARETKVRTASHVDDAGEWPSVAARCGELLLLLHSTCTFTTSICCMVMDSF